jgi:polyhydroxyalkanoate synthesis regulator phasin
MKTSGINELRALVAEALTQEDAAKLTEAIVRATELAEEEAKPVTRDYLDARLSATESALRKDLSDLRSEFADKLRDQTRWLTGTFVVIMMVAVILQHFWR